MIVKMFKKPIFSTILSIILGFLVASIILLFTQYSPIDVIRSIFSGIFSKPKYIVNVITKSTPLILTGVSVALAFKMGLFNIGAEGQFIVGSIASTIVGITLNLPPILEIPLILIAGSLAGGIFGAIVGYLKAKFGIHEVITSIMLNWIALYLTNFVIKYSSFKKLNSNSTYPINESGYTILPNTLNMNTGIVIAIIIDIFISFLLYKTKKGYELRAVGFNHYAAEFAGINVNRNILYAMLISGAVSGLAGALKITGEFPHCISQLTSFEGNGLNGLPVALIASSSPIGCIASGLFFGGLLNSAKTVQSETRAPSDIINIIIGTIVFFIALSNLFPKIAEKINRKLKKHKI